MNENHSGIKIIKHGEPVEESAPVAIHGEYAIADRVRDWVSEKRKTSKPARKEISLGKLFSRDLKYARNQRTS